MYFHDLWEYVDRKLANNGVAVIAHPTDQVRQVASGLNGGSAVNQNPEQAYNYLKKTNEIDQINQLTLMLENVIEDDLTPPKIKEQARN
jgi:hypothetical protein